MRGLNKLQQLKDSMMKPIYEKRRHLGCEFCGTTFYGYYTKDGDSFNNTVNKYYSQPPDLRFADLRYSHGDWPHEGRLGSGTRCRAS